MEEARSEAAGELDDEMVVVGDAGDFIEDEGRLVRVGNRELAVFRHNGAVHAIDRTCPHAGGPLEEGVVFDGLVMCPLHAYSFDLETGACPEDPTFEVACYPVRELDGRVLVGRWPRARPRGAAKGEE